MITEEMVPQLVGRQAYDRDGQKIGKVGQVFVDDRDGRPLWATVNTGMFGTTESFVPLASADVTDRDLTVAVTKDAVKHAPQVDHGGEHISDDEQGRLYRHYAGAGHEQASAGEDGRGTDAGQSMTRSEERLRVGTESAATGSVRLRKYVVTEEQQVTVPVRHEEVRLERTPIGDGERTGAATIGDDEQEVTLHAERPVVDTQTEAVERVRLGTETVTEQETVSGTVRKEQIEVDDPQQQLRGDRDDRR